MPPLQVGSITQADVIDPGSTAFGDAQHHQLVGQCLRPVHVKYGPSEQPPIGEHMKPASCAQHDASGPSDT
jgi:hypothetical protein